MIWIKFSLICTVNIIFEYINYRWNAKGRHGTHSPFVYDFTDKCLKIPIDSAFNQKRKDLFKQLKSDNSTIHIKDFGAGSKYLGNERKISQIFKTSSSKGKYGDLLFKLAKYYQPSTILEFGTSLGIGTIHLASGNPTSTVITVEACSETRNQALKNIKTFEINSIESKLGTFDDFLESHEGKSFDLVFVDGHHDGEALKKYMEQLEKFTHNDTIFILDDIRWSDSMLAAWNWFVKHPDYHVTMDLFRMGIVVKRPQQVKEHFTIKL
jgi:predicted O-methyltransferase YrrM